MGDLKAIMLTFGSPSFACDLVCIYLSESFDFLKVNIGYVVATFVA